MMAAAKEMPTEWRAFSRPDELAAEWRVFEQTAIGSPFQHFSWVRLYQEVQSRPAVFVAGYAHGALQAIFPLEFEAGVLTWFGEALGNHHAPLLDSDLHERLTSDDVEVLWRGVHSALPAPPCASILRRQPLEIAGRPNPFASWSAVTEPTSSYALSLGTDWERFHASMHSASTRKIQRKKERGLAREGPVEIGRVTGAAEIHAGVLLMLRWKSEQVEATGGRNNFAHKANRTLLARFAAEHPEAARLYAVKLNGRPIALAYRIEAGRRPVLYQMAYEPGPTAKFSPGRILLNHIIRHAIEERCEVLDLSVGDEPYKKDLCDLRTALASSIKVHSVAGLRPALLERGKLAAKAFIKSNPAAHAAVLKAHARLSRRSAPPG